MELEQDIAPLRRRINDVFVATVGQIGLWAMTHWLALANLGTLIFVGLPVAAPTLMRLGLTEQALWIYAGYGLVCHQWPARSFFLFGSQMVYSWEEMGAMAGTDQLYSYLGGPLEGFKIAFCQRYFAIYASVLLAGLLFVKVRHRLRPPSLSFYLFLVSPMALDGFTQLFGWRESTWELRLLTGGLFGLATTWLAYTKVEEANRKFMDPWRRPRTRAASTAKGTQP